MGFERFHVEFLLWRSTSQGVLVRCGISKPGYCRWVDEPGSFADAGLLPWLLVAVADTDIDRGLVDLALLTSFTVRGRAGSSGLKTLVHILQDSQVLSWPETQSLPV